MRLLVDIGGWILSVVVVGLLLHVTGTLLTEKLKDWYAARSVTRTKKQITRLEDDLAIVEGRNKQEHRFLFVLMKTALLALSRISIGSYLCFYALSVRGSEYTLLFDIEIGLGIGFFSSAWMTIVLSALPDLDKMLYFNTYKAKTEKRIARLKASLPVLPPADPPKIS